MKNKVKLLDVVALTDDLPEHELKRGQVGTVVEVLIKKGRPMQSSQSRQISCWFCTTSQNSPENSKLRE